MELSVVDFSFGGFSECENFEPAAYGLHGPT